jgi:undecaprenyl-diphosphatase
VTTEAVKKSRAQVALLLLAGLLMAGAAVCFFTVDERVFSYLRENPQTWQKLRWAEAIKQLGRGYTLIWLLLAWVGITGKHKTVIVCLLSLLIALAAVTVIKETVRRPRPRDVITAQTKTGDQKDIYKSWSFPSADTASVFAAAAVLALAMPWPATLAFAACCCGVAILRVIVLAHYPSDVFGGTATGILSGWLAILTKNRFPEIVNICRGHERMLSFAGVILIPILMWCLQGIDKLIILLEFYAPIVLIMVIFNRLQTVKIETGR